MGQTTTATLSPRSITKVSERSYDRLMVELQTGTMFAELREGEFWKFKVSLPRCIWAMICVGFTDVMARNAPTSMGLAKSTSTGRCKNLSHLEIMLTPVVEAPSGWHPGQTGRCMLRITMIQRPRRRRKVQTCRIPLSRGIPLLAISIFSPPSRPPYA